MYQSVNLPPTADEFPQYPKSWYPLCRATELGSKPIHKKILNLNVVVFRSSPENIVAMDAYCAHMGANLAGGCTQGTNITCPFHGWTYDSTGQCISIPHRDDIPSFAKQKTYPVLEKHGYIFIFNDRKAHFPLPFFLGEREDDYVSGRPFRFIANAPWYMMAAHAFDLAHIEMVHDRALQGPLLVDQPTPHAMRAQHDSLVVGSNKFDRLIRLFLGNRVHISMTPYAGLFVLVTGDFDKAKSRFFLMITPLGDNKSQVDGLIFSPKKGNILQRLIRPLSMEIRRIFTKGYLVDENNTLGNHIYRPHTMDPKDHTLINYFRWLADYHKLKLNKNQYIAEIQS